MKKEYSAGGIVFKEEKGDLLILLAKHSGHHGWVFPKGHIGDTDNSETKEQAALREVQEETGARGVIAQALSPITYWYEWNKQKRHKTVYYFLMEYHDGDITKHDNEMEEVEWLPHLAVMDKLTYPSDRKVWQEAQKRLGL